MNALGTAGHSLCPVPLPVYPVFSGCPFTASAAVPLLAISHPFSDVVLPLSEESDYIINMDVPWVWGLHPDLRRRAGSTSSSAIGLAPRAPPAGSAAGTPPRPLGNFCGHPRPAPPPGPPTQTPEGHPGRQPPPLRKLISRKDERFEEGRPGLPPPLGGAGGAPALIGRPRRVSRAHWPARPPLRAPGPPPP
ncbi:unnamed protein product [Nyctereutes procyonoides]|uniref:(raccoon dog) hypothetical protein n=1 Tax=Nyctereutes procyonoides TaxID=34880 RepID=A0A811ZK09_NYCPR|nr:unnamed protein product [Nyctereutes procyonoides]